MEHPNKVRENSVKQHTFDGPDKSFLKSKSISEQENDPELLLLPVELDKVSLGYYVKNDALMRKMWPPNCNTPVIHHIVVAKEYQSDILKLTHESSMSGHSGIKKPSKTTKYFCNFL